jgi:hypothetical protein
MSLLAKPIKKELIMVENKLSEIIKLLCEASDDATKFDNGNSSAGTRVRKAAQDATHALKDLRKAVSEVKNERKGG